MQTLFNHYNTKEKKEKKRKTEKNDYEILISKPNNETFQPSDIAYDHTNGFMFASVEGPEQQGVGYIAQWKLTSSSSSLGDVGALLGFLLASLIALTNTLSSPALNSDTNLVL